MKISKQNITITKWPNRFVAKTFCSPSGVVPSTRFKAPQPVVKILAPFLKTREKYHSYPWTRGSASLPWEPEWMYVSNVFFPIYIYPEMFAIFLASRSNFNPQLLFNLLHSEWPKLNIEVLAVLSAVRQGCNLSPTSKFPDFSLTFYSFSYPLTDKEKIILILYSNGVNCITSNLGVTLQRQNLLPEGANS